MPSSWLTKGLTDIRLVHAVDRSPGSISEDVVPFPVGNEDHPLRIHGHPCWSVEANPFVPSVRVGGLWARSRAGALLAAILLAFGALGGPLPAAPLVLEATVRGTEDLHSPVALIADEEHVHVVNADGHGVVEHTILCALFSKRSGIDAVCVKDMDSIGLVSHKDFTVAIQDNIQRC